MSADDQQFLDILSAVPNDVRKYTNEIADAIDRHLDRVSVSLRDHMPNSWLRHPSQPLSSPVLYEPTLYNNIQVFAKKNRKILIRVAVFLGISAYLVYRNRKAYGRKRRAKRASNGARAEVVLVAGSPNEPITRSLSLDLERRGFIVFVVCNTIEEELLVQNEGRTDIKPLMLDVANVSISFSQWSYVTLRKGNTNTYNQSRRMQKRLLIVLAYSFPHLNTPFQVPKPTN